MVRKADLLLAMAGSTPSHDTAWLLVAGKLYWGVTTVQVNSALHPSGVDKSSTSFGCGKGEKVTSVGYRRVAGNTVGEIEFISTQLRKLINSKIGGLPEGYTPITAGNELWCHLNIQTFSKMQK